MPFCTTCGYDLAAHVIGDRCPECGSEISRTSPGPLPSPAAALIGLGIVPVLAILLWVFRDDPRFLYTWIASEFLVVVLVAVSLLQFRRAGVGGYWWSFVMATAAFTGPLATLVLFMWVFVIGGSSNVAQMAGDGIDLWSLWFHAWPILLVGNPICGILAVVSAALPPYQIRYCGSWALPSAVLVAAIAAAHITLVYFPDA